MALPFAASADFAIDKAEGVPCPNLQDDHRCGIHDRLRPSGFSGCTAYDCFGAGQQVTQVTFRGADWRQDPEVAATMFAAFRALRPVHELLAYLDAAASWSTSGPLAGDLHAARDRLEHLAGGDADAVTAIDLDELRATVAPLLRRAADLARAGAGGSLDDLAGADLVGADLRGRDLRGADLRGALLVGADLRKVDLRAASLLGADLRGADLRGADLSGALYLTQAQVHAARGDARTTLSQTLVRPEHW